MRKYLSYSCVLLVGLFGGYIFGINYESYEENEISFLNHSADLLAPLAKDYDLLEKGTSQSNEEFRKAVLCRVLAQRKYVSAVMRRYDDSVLNEVDRGVELLNERDQLLDQANSLVPEGTNANEFLDKECKTFHR